MKKRHLMLTLFAATALSVSAQTYPYQNKNLSFEERAADLCSRLTLDEKVNLMMRGSEAIERLDIPQFEWWSEGLHGLGRNGYATVFPITMGMAASWDPVLLEQVFSVVSDEARVKNQQAKRAGEIKKYQGLSIWTPNINIFRDPRWGRGQETYGEDPWLTARMGVAVVRGLEGDPQAKYRKTLACAKHFAVHSGPEWNRHSFNVENLPARDLWETYLPAFKALIQEANVAEVMCAYQRIDGQPCCGNNHYLQQILRTDLGFKGLVVSDCGAIGDFWIKGRHEVSPDAAAASAKAVLAGTDVECGVNYKRLPDAVKRGEITEEQIDVSVRRLLVSRLSLGDLDADDDVEWTRIPESVVACQASKDLALKMARETMTLLQNRDGVLPLAHGAKVAVLGPNANDSVTLWGNYSGYPTSTVTILKGIQGKTPNVKFIKGVGYTRNEMIDSRFDEIRGGLKATYWNNMEFQGQPAAKAVYGEAVNLSNGGATVFAPGVNLEQFSARYEGVLVPSRSETMTFQVNADDLVRLIVNGDTVINSWKARARIVENKRELAVEAGKEYNIQIDYVQNKDVAVMQFDLGPVVAVDGDRVAREVSDADYVIFVGGISPKLEGEEMKVTDPGFKGGDRTTIELPQSQRDLIARLHKEGKKVIFVNCSGGAVALTPESANADAILQAWYGGEQGGQAVADVLFGDYNPEGRLPVTFYKDDSQLPDFLDYTMSDRTYRFFDGQPLWAFGHGLSYTTFRYGKPQYKDGAVTFTVENTGDRDGVSIAQVYLRNPADKVLKKTLRAFERVSLKAGEKKTVTVAFPRDRFECWDASTNTMRVVPGKYEILVGQSSDDAGMKVTGVKVK